MSRIIAIRIKSGRWVAALQVNKGTEELPDWSILAYLKGDFKDEDSALQICGDLFQDVPLVTYSDRLLLGEPI